MTKKITCMSIICLPSTVVVCVDKYPFNKKSFLEMKTLTYFQACRKFGKKCS